MSTAADQVVRENPSTCCLKILGPGKEIPNGCFERPNVEGLLDDISLEYIKDHDLRCGIGSSEKRIESAQIVLSDKVVHANPVSLCSFGGTPFQPILHAFGL